MNGNEVNKKNADSKWKKIASIMGKWIKKKLLKGYTHRIHRGAEWQSESSTEVSGWKIKKK